MFGCGTALNETRINSPARPMSPRPAGSVEVFTSGAPTRPHIDVAVLEAQQETAFSVSDTSDMISELRRRAGELGCDALAITGPNNSVVSSRYHTSTLHGLFATCIEYTDVGVAASGSGESPEQ
jgi:hypothetical protein